MTDLTELNKLEKWLKENHFIYKRTDKPPTPVSSSLFKYEPVGERHQLIITDRKGKILWDAICHWGSYGYEKGLLEIMGVIVDEEKAGDTVEGYLTADEVIDRINAWLQSGVKLDEVTING
jgi:hypothetical protein